MTTTMQAIAHLVIDEDTEYRHYGYETASAYDQFVLKAGEYPFRLVNLNYTPWVPGARGRLGESGLPTAPYYAIADVSALLVEQFYVNRLFTASKAVTTPVNQMTTHRVQLYAYELEKRKTWGTIGRIVVNPDWRADTFPCIADLTDDQYRVVRDASIRWMDRQGHGDVSVHPDWHIWNQIEGKALAGIQGFSKAALEGYVR